MEKWYIGIDPGKDGGITVLSSSLGFIAKYLVPKIGKDVDINEFYKIFIDIKQEAIKNDAQLHVCVESVHSIFNVAAKANFTFGYVVGIIDTIIVAHSLSFSKVQPKDWQSNIWQQYEIEREPSKTDSKGKIKQGKVLTKVTSLKAFKRLFPNVDLRGTERSKNQHDGLVDSLLIAEYCRRQNH